MKPSENQKRGRMIAEGLLKYGIPLTVSIGLCWLLFRNFDFGEMWKIIRGECHYGFILIMMALSVISHIIRAARWQIQLRALSINVPFFDTVLSIFGMYAVNLVFPRLGEIWRTGYISRKEKSPFADVFGSMVADRIADTVTVLLMFLVLFLCASSDITSRLEEHGILMNIRDIVFSPVLWGIVIFIIVSLGVILTIKSQNPLIGKLREGLKGLWRGVSVVVYMKGKIKWLILTVLLWGCYFMQFYVTFYSFDFTAQLLARYGLLPALFGFVLSSMSMGVPSYGGIGPWQWAVIISLETYGLGIERGGAFANLVLGSTTLLTIFLGLFTFIFITLGKRKTKIITT